MDKRQKRFSMWYFMGTLFFMWIFSSMIYGPYVTNRTQVSYSTFLADLAANSVDSVNLTSDRIVYTLKESKGNTGEIKLGQAVVRNTVRIDDPGIVGRLEAAGVTFGGVAQTRSALDTLFGMLIPFIPMIVIWYFIYKRMGGGNASVMSFGKSQVQEIQGELTGVKFADVGGISEAEVELREIIDFIKEPARFDKIGAKLPKGVLLVGPPGTGKTLLAKATAGEAGVPFFCMTGSSFVEMFVGVGAARVRDLFEQAKKKAPCIIFIDEIDAIGQSRSSNPQFGGNSERENTLNQLLAEMDGFAPNMGVVLMAATNRPETLDQALVRPGRFDRQIQVDLPSEDGRLEILKIHTRKMPLADDVRLEALAKVTAGFSGADLANIANEASLLAVRKEQSIIRMADFDLAVERVVAGLQKKTPLSEDVRKKVAYHEMGHALVAHYLPYADPVHKVSIIPTAKGALGYTMQLPEEDQYLMSEEELRTRMAVMLGGRAAEQMIFGESTTGASNDLERATELARRMVCEFGMSRKLGPVRYAAASGMYLQSGSYNRTDLSPDTIREIDGEIRAMLFEAQEKATAILKEHEAVLHETSRVLQEKESIGGDTIATVAKEIEGA